MKVLWVAAGILLDAVILVADMSYAATTDSGYQLSEASSSWDGTAGSRLKAPTVDYDYTYGDESSVTYTLPWSFPFYGKTYSRITADTNGNIWFTSTGSAHSHNLASTGRGPVITAWNNDLSSYFYGGVYVQHKTNPERVVIEWQTETYTDEGEYRPNQFEILLYQDGVIRFDYNSFDPSVGKDFGSGVSTGDGTSFLSITENFGRSFTLAGRSFLFSPLQRLFQVNIGGTGSGSVTSEPQGIACNASCSANFFGGSQVFLSAQPAEYSIFDGWSDGPCSGIGACEVTMVGDILTNATFTYDAAHQTRIDGGTSVYFPSLQAAYDAAVDGTAIKLWGVTFNENLSCGRPVTVKIEGGFDASYSGTFGETVVNGSVTIVDGTVVIDGLAIR